MHVWYPLRSEEGIGSPGIGLQGAAAGSQGNNRMLERNNFYYCVTVATLGFLTFILPDERIKDESRGHLIYSHGTSVKEGEPGISCFYLYLRKYKSE